MQALYYAGGAVTGNRKTHKAWLSVYRARPHLRGENQSLWAWLIVSALYSDAHSVWQKKISCKCRLRLSGAYVDATLAYAD
jgi:hypothetical protein